MKKLQLQLVGKGERSRPRPFMRSVTFRDLELLEMVREHSSKHKLPFSMAVEELLSIAFETLQNDKLDTILKSVRDKNRAALVSSRVFDFRKDCFGCGAKDSLVRIHGHVQCKACGANVEPCCE